MQEQILSIKSFGARLRVKDGLFEVTVPDMSGAGEHRTQQFVPHTVQTILLHRHTSASSDAMLLAEQNAVNFLILDERSSPTLFLAGLTPPGSIEIWKRQIALHGTPEGLGFARDWLCIKIQRKLKWLSKLKRYREGEPVRIIQDCEKALQELLLRMKALPLRDAAKAAESLRGLEGSGQRTYLQTLSALLPPHLRFDGRSKRPSIDLFNAMLNYAYGILYGWVEKILWKTGLNPYFGFLHGDTRKQKNMLYDFIEPYRPWVDKVVFNLCARKEASTQHLSELSGGGVWLNEDGTSMLTKAVNERLDEKKESGGENARSFRQSIEYDARAFVRRLLGREDQVPDPAFVHATLEM
ncbi:MAG: CRISPR-associated endonuclease Cas1 [Saprospiraceae bacterium]|nr:CRISPR-associated endonuclease Cas1 [Saprospiraceae bacterium]